MLLEESKYTLEALFFIRGDEGLDIDYCSTFFDVSLSEAENMLNIFKEEYDKKETALVVKKFGNVYKLLIKDKIYNNIKENLSSKKLLKLSKVALETLAIIAYNQPISKIEINKIRGVNSDNIIQKLLEKELIISNKVLDKIGKPKLYETTDLFLDVFGLESIDELPKFKNTTPDGEQNDNTLLDDFLAE